MKLSEAFRAQPKALLFAEALLLAVAIGYLDSISWDLSMFLFYAFPILILVWFSDRRSAIICAVACGVIWFLAKLNTHPYGGPLAFVWAAFNRIAYFLFVAIGGTALKTQREEMRARMDAMLQTRALEQEIVRVSEREQIRIGQDLHDGLCQNLAAIDCAAACLKSDLEARALPEAEAASVIQHLLRNAIIEARDLARGVFPVQMDTEGLPAALAELVHNTNRTRQVQTTFEVEGDARITDPQVRMHLYRIAQQALNNALTHAAAKRIAVRMIEVPGSLQMSIIDDGRGIDTSKSPSRGMGLRTMEYRARSIGADLVVESSPTTGTHIRCILPVSNNSPLQ